MPPKMRFLNPLTTFLLFVATLLTVMQVEQRMAAQSEIACAGQEARLIELRWAASKQFGMKYTPTENISTNKWNVAVEAVLMSEGGSAGEARALLPHTPDGAFRTCWMAAYDSGPLPSEDEVLSVRDGLAGGLASSFLEAALLSNEAEASRMHQDALSTYIYKALALYILVLCLIVSALAGIGVSFGMLKKRRPILPAPFLEMSSALAVRVCLGWYVLFLSSGTIIGLFNGFFPLGLWALPMAYSFHAVFGVAFICAAEKITPSELWNRISKKATPWMSSGIQFLALAIGFVLLLAVILSLFVPEGETAQRELMDLIRNTRGIVPFVLMFGTVAVLGPAFEEIFFRGFLLSVLRRHYSTFWSLVFSSLLFGAIHFQLLNLPFLACLGAALGFAFLVTRDIRVAIFVHGCWNGGVFLIQKFLLA